jgi:lipoteichoic acid synthase
MPPESRHPNFRCQRAQVKRVLYCRNVPERELKPRTFRGTESQFFVIALVAPLMLLDLACFASKLVQRYDVIAREGISPWIGGPGIALYAMLGDVSFACFCCLLLCIRQQGGTLWLGVAGFLQICAFHVGLVNTASYAYFLQTLDGLDAPLLKHMLLQPSDLGLVMAGEVTLWQWCFLALVFVVAIIAPWMARSWARSRPIPPYPGRERRSLRKAWLLFASCLPVSSLGILRPLVPVKDVALARAPVLQLVVTTLAPYEVDPSVDQAVSEARVFEPGVLTIERESNGPPRNLVVLVLESTRARSTTPYTPALRTTPFLDSIAKQSLMVEKAYAVMPSTAKALTAIFCSIIPAPNLVPTVLNEDLLGRCLPQLLREQGYQTMYMQSANPRFEGRLSAIPAMGFDTFVKDDDMPHEGFQQANFLGYEDDTMLEPTENWLRAHKTKPFLVSYLTVNPHHDYNELTRHGVQHFATNGDETLDHYLNNIYAQDAFMRSLFELYKKAGVFQNTLFVIVGDHGEGFGEHGRRAHNSVPYEEGLRVPLLFYDPSGKLVKPGKLAGPVSQLDIMPTLLKLLDFKVTHGRMHGLTIWDSPPERVLMSSCLGGCATRTTDTEAFIHHYGRRPDELYDLRTDPGELNDLASQYPQLVERRKEELLQFEKRIGSFFFMHQLQAEHALRLSKK